MLWSGLPDVAHVLELGHVLAVPEAGSVYINDGRFVHAHLRLVGSRELRESAYH
jgi:hypothetical protein